MQLLINNVDYTPYIVLNTMNCAVQSNNTNTFSVQLDARCPAFGVGMELKFLIDNEIIFGGLVNVINKEIVALFDRGKSFAILSLEANGYSQILARRTFDIKNLSGVYAGELVSSLITNFLADDGLKAGKIDKGALITSWNPGCINAKETLETLAEKCGYIWLVDEQKNIHFCEKYSFYECEKKLVEYPTLPTHISRNTSLSCNTDLAFYKNKQFIVCSDGAGQQIIGSAVNQAGIDFMATQYGSGVYGNVLEFDQLATQQDADYTAEHLLLAYGGIPRVVNLGTYDKAIKCKQFIYVNLPNLGIGGNWLAFITGITYTQRALKIHKQVSIRVLLEDGHAPIRITNTRKVRNSDGIEHYVNQLEYYMPKMDDWTRKMNKMRTGTKCNGNGNSGAKLSQLLGLSITTDTIDAKFVDGMLNATYDLDANGRIVSININGGQVIPITY